MQLSIIIVNYNVKFFLEHCLLSVIKACKNIDAEIFVIDNNSTDGSEAYLSPKFPSVNFYWNKINLGFGKANNSVLKDAKGEYVLFLNPDVIVPEDCFTKCLYFFSTHSDAGALGVRMIDGSGQFLKESKRCLPTPAAGFFKMVGLSGLFPSSSFFAKYYAGHLPETENNKTEVLAGAFMMLSKKTLNVTNGFDEAFFMYGEDIDLSYRILQTGLQNYYVGEITIIHFKGESTQKKSAQYIEHFYGAIKLFVCKHYNHLPFIKFFMIWMIQCGKLFATLKIIFSSKKTNAIPQQLLNIIFIGNEAQLVKTNAILKNTFHNISHKIFFLKEKTLENILSKKMNDASNAMLFCEGEISNIFLIEKLHLIPKKYTALFYENGAQSIIGSNDKNERGIIISVHE